MTLHRPRSLITMETPIERMFRRIIKQTSHDEIGAPLFTSQRCRNKKSDWHLK
jgi:hypothetical protein